MKKGNWGRVSIERRGERAGQKWAEQVDALCREKGVHWGAKTAENVLGRDGGRVGIEESGENVNSNAVSVPSAETSHDLCCLGSRDESRTIGIHF